ncbi:MAG: hypothetical protein AB9835_09890 [Eubacteriales bacterium]
MPITTDMVVSGIFIGLMLGAVYSFYNKYVLGSFVAKLIELGATSSLNAHSLEQAGQKSNYLLKAALREKGMLRKVVLEDPDRSGYYYIPEENTQRAHSTYGKKSATVIALIVTLIVLIAVMVLTSFLLPNIINLISTLMGFVIPSSGA